MSQSHPEWELQNALTAPADRDRNAPNALNRNQLPPDQVDLAISALNVKDNLTYIKYDRLYADPVIPNQVFCLHSFVPSKGATPDRDGIYGMIKFRGVFSELDEASKHAEYLIKNTDSYHHIYHSYCGRPIPLTRDPRYVSERSEVAVDEKLAKIVSEEVKTRREEERREVKEIQERERRLRKGDDVENKEEDDEEKYTVLNVKRAQLTWTYVENMKKLEEIKNNIIKARKQIAEYDEKFPDFKNTYFEKYKKARRDTGFNTDDSDTFVKYLVDDFDLGF